MDRYNFVTRSMNYTEFSELQQELDYYKIPHTHFDYEDLKGNQWWVMSGHVRESSMEPIELLQIKLTIENLAVVWIEAGGNWSGTIGIKE